MSDVCAYIELLKMSFYALIDLAPMSRTETHGIYPLRRNYGIDEEIECYLIAENPQSMIENRGLPADGSISRALHDPSRAARR